MFISCTITFHIGRKEEGEDGQLRLFLTFIQTLTESARSGIEWGDDTNVVVFPEICFILRDFL